MHFSWQTPDQSEINSFIVHWATETMGFSPENFCMCCTCLAAEPAQAATNMGVSFIWVSTLVLCPCCSFNTFVMVVLTGKGNRLVICFLTQRQCKDKEKITWAAVSVFSWSTHTTERSPLIVSSLHCFRPSWQNENYERSTKNVALSFQLL